jgi:hypothetical protein
MADNVQPDAGDEREATSGLLISTDPLQPGAVGYQLSASGDTVPSADSEADDVDFDSDEDGGGDDSDDSDSDDGGGGGALVIEAGANTGDSDNGDSDNGDSDNGDSDS